MKKILEFDSPEDDELFDLSNKGPEYSFVISDFLSFLRQKEKYEDTTSLPIDEIRAKIIELLNERNLPLSWKHLLVGRKLMLRADIYYCLNKDVLIPRLTKDLERSFVLSVKDDTKFKITLGRSSAYGMVDISDEDCDEHLKNIFVTFQIRGFSIYPDEVIPAKKLKFINEINKLWIGGKHGVTRSVREVE